MVAEVGMVCQLIQDYKQLSINRFELESISLKFSRTNNRKDETFRFKMKILQKQMKKSLKRSSVFFNVSFFLVFVISIGG